jgi:hypothetical protein
MTWQSDEPCVACGTMAVDRCYHHIYTRKAHHEHLSSTWNKITLCHLHHTEIHARGTKVFATKYLNVLNWLMANEWYMCEFRETWRHD